MGGLTLEAKSSINLVSPYGLLIISMTKKNKKLRRLPTFNWLDIKTANERQIDGIYDNNYQAINIDPRLGNKRLIKTLIHEFLHYLSDTYPEHIKPLKEKDIYYFTKQIFDLIKK